MAQTYTEAQINAMTLPKLRTLAAELFDADDIKGLKKTQLQETLNGYFAEEASAEDDDELDDDEVTSYDQPAIDRAKAREAELEDDEVDDISYEQVAQAVERAQGKLPARETYTAKQVATRIGTDAKALRKFFRSDASTTKAVGLGGRYEFDAKDMPAIAAEFKKWNTSKPARVSTASTPKKAEKPTRMATPAVVEEDEELDLDDELEDDEPTDDELDDLELDDDDELDD